jgi:hypothetical protein
MEAYKIYHGVQVVAYCVVINHHEADNKVGTILTSRQTTNKTYPIRTTTDNVIDDLIELVFRDEVSNYKRSRID